MAFGFRISLSQYPEENILWQIFWHWCFEANSKYCVAGKLAMGQMGGWWDQRWSTQASWWQRGIRWTVGQPFFGTFLFEPNTDQSIWGDSRVRPPITMFGPNIIKCLELCRPQGICQSELIAGFDLLGPTIFCLQKLNSVIPDRIHVTLYRAFVQARWLEASTGIRKRTRAWGWSVQSHLLTSRY